MDHKNETPSKPKTNLRHKILASSMHCDSPFRALPKQSTPPSRFARILNPFDAQLIDRMHLPTLSPSVFAQGSTPKTEKKFKWSIDDISSLQPADIDEETVSQHVSDHDPTVESIVQEKISQFFSDKIAPSPMTEAVVRVPLIEALAPPAPGPTVDNSAQTVLTLPPVLPAALEAALAPYFKYNADQQHDSAANNSLYRKLFQFPDQENSIAHSSVSPPEAPSTGLYPVAMSPHVEDLAQKRNFESPGGLQFGDCTLSPIGRSPVRESRSACRLSFSAHMSVDASVCVPDVNRSLSFNVSGEPQTSPPAVEEEMGDTTSNWDMEYNQVSLLSKSPDSSRELYDSSNSNTPHSKIFTSQRKRLSDSFKDEDDSDDNIEMEESAISVGKRPKPIGEDRSDGGYQTGGMTSGDNTTWEMTAMFASTPTKNKH